MSQEFDFVTVSVGRVPGQIHEYALNGGRTVSDALAVAGLDPAGFTVTVNNSTDFDAGDELESGDLVLLAKKTKGN